MTEEELENRLDQYQLEAEVYQSVYEDKIRGAKAILIMHGVLCSMESELINHELKNGQTKRAKEQQNRLGILKDICYEFSAIDTRNNVIQIILSHKNREYEKLQEELNEAKKEVELLKKQLEFEK